MTNKKKYKRLIGKIPMKKFLYNYRIGCKMCGNDTGTSALKLNAGQNI